MKLAIQGITGSFHDQAARALFDAEQVSLIECGSFQELFIKLDETTCDLAVVASDNSLYGSIREVYDSLLERPHLQIIGEHYLRIEHCLIGTTGSAISDITDVFSHAVALDQCREYLTTTLASADQHLYYDTAGAVKDIIERNKPHEAAIASAHAAKLYGGTILQQGIETNHQNFTRFIVVARGAKPLRSPTKTTVVLKTADNGQHAGSLHAALACFANANINLSRIESRPIIGQAWKYQFFIDFDSDLSNASAQQALLQLDNLGCSVTVLGTY